MVQMGDFETNEYLFKTDGTVIARTTYHRENARWAMELRKNGKWVDGYVTTAPLDGPAMLGLSLDEKSVVMTIRDEKTGEYRLANVSIADSKLGELYGPDKPFRIVTDNANHVIGTVTDSGYRQYHFDEPRLAAAWSMITGVFPGRQLTLSVAYARLRQDRGLCRRHRRPGRLLHAGLERQEAQQGRVGLSRPDRRRRRRGPGDQVRRRRRL
jgi:hypothetical protein